MERKKEGCEDMKRLKDNDWKERKKYVRTGKDWKIMIGKKERKDVRTWKDWKIMIGKKERSMWGHDWKKEIERKKDVRTGKDWKIMIGKKERRMWGHEKTER